MTSKEILSHYFSYYKQHNHEQIPNISLVPQGDSTLLFVNCGMFPLVPYLSGEPHPLGKRLMSVQRSIRFSDIEEIGDNRHTTAFHMMGNWSLGDYFKEEQLNWIYTYFIEKLGLDPTRLYATIFKGDQYAPKDTESFKTLVKIFGTYGIKASKGKHIFVYDRQENWWQRGEAVGELGGPSSEVFYYLGEGTGEGKDIRKHQDEFLEIGNNVFMEYKRNKDNGWDTLPQKNIDFGGGLERIALVVQKRADIFETDNFWPIIQEIERLSGKKYKENLDITQAMRILADHMRTAVFLAMDGVIPTNKDQGYVLRRFLRRIARFSKKLGIKDASSHLVPVVAKALHWIYPDLEEKKQSIIEIFQEEEEKFQTVLEQSEKQLGKTVDRLKSEHSSIEALAQVTFDFYQSLGTPPEMTREFFQERHIINDSEVSVFHASYEKKVKEHQEKSRKSAEQKFKGGLADSSRQVVQYHTATHLLHEALRRILGTHVRQYGSNITRERLRFDFSHTEKLSNVEIQQTEKLINETIALKLPVQYVMLSKKEAEESGALHFFKEKYGKTVKVYFVGKSLESAFSKEFCGGPHVDSLGNLAPTFSIFKQESVGKGVRRIYATCK